MRRIRSCSVNFAARHKWDLSRPSRYIAEIDHVSSDPMSFVFTTSRNVLNEDIRIHRRRMQTDVSFDAQSTHCIDERRSAIKDASLTVDTITTKSIKKEKKRIKTIRKRKIHIFRSMTTSVIVVYLITLQRIITGDDMKELSIMKNEDDYLFIIH